MTALALLLLWLIALFAWRIRAANRTIRAAQDGSYLQDRGTADVLAAAILADAEARGLNVPKDRPSMAPVGETPSPAPAQGTATNP